MTENGREAPRALPEGRIIARYVTYDLGFASTGTEQIGVLFDLQSPPWGGQQLTWYGTLTDAALPVTCRMLSDLGWKGERIDTLRKDLVPGREFELTVKIETFQGKARPKVLWARPRGIVRMDRGMSAEQRTGLAHELNAKIEQGLHVRELSPRDVEELDDLKDDDIPF
jgi:hypothetical protein